MIYEETFSISINGHAQDHRMRFEFEVQYIEGCGFPIINRTTEVHTSGRTIENDFWEWCPPCECLRIMRVLMDEYLKRSSETLGDKDNGTQHSQEGD